MDLGGKLDLVQRLGRLREEGALTDDEFENAKAQVLDGGSGELPKSVNVETDEFELASTSSVASKWIAAGTAVALLAGVGGYFVLSSARSAPPAAASSAPSSPQPQSSAQTAAGIAPQAPAVAAADAALNTAAEDTAAAQSTVSEPVQTEAPAPTVTSAAQAEADAIAAHAKAETRRVATQVVSAQAAAPSQPAVKNCGKTDWGAASVSTC
jgi:hypothetical protein